MKTILFFLLLSSTAFSSEILLNFENLKSKEGLMQIALFDSAEGFPQSHSGAELFTLKLEDAQTISLKNIGPGEYAIAVYHDKNSDFELNTNGLGIPKEGFGFSNNPRILFGAPKFKKAKFKLKASENKKMLIKLKHF